VATTWLKTRAGWPGTIRKSLEGWAEEYETKADQNRFYMKYAPDERGDFAGQGGYGYVSFEKFVDAVTDLKDGKVTLDELDKRNLPTLKNTLATAAILEAGRRSLDENRSVDVVIPEGEGEWQLK
jgi:D-galacturonate reductase